MDPSIALIKSFQDPPNSTRATSVDQMFSITWGDTPNYEYRVGMKTSNPFRFFVIKNKTISHDLKVSVSVPNWILTETEIVIPKNGGHYTFKLALRDDAAEGLSKTFQRVFEDSIKVEITPLNVNSPVYVSTTIAD